LLLAVLEFSARSRNPLAIAAAAVGAIVVALAISPEIGIALFFGLLVAFGVKAVLGDRRGRFPLLTLVVTALGLAILVARLPTFGSFAGGAYYFPVLAGPPAVLYVGCIMLLAWSAAAGLRGADAQTASVQAGWAAATVVLAASALGRADFGHIFWNGLGAFLAAPAILLTHRRWQSRSLTAAFAATFLALLAVYAAIAYVPPATISAARAGAVSPEQATAISKFSPRFAGLAGWANEVQDPAKSADVPALLRDLNSIAVPNSLAPEIMSSLAARHALVPNDGLGITAADALRGQAKFSRADYLLLTTADYETLVSLTSADTTTPDPPMVRRPFFNGRRLDVLALTGWPLVPTTRYPDFDTELFFGRYLAREWKTYRVAGAYTVLRRAGQ
jgi:hypothetical protein